MAISKMSSRQLMNILDEAEDSMSTLRSNVNSMRQELDRRLAVFSNAMEFSTHTIGKFNEYLLQKEDAGTSTAILSEMSAVEGEYSKYGLNVLPAFVSTPANVFNFLSATGPIYKNNANVYIGDQVAPGYTSILMHDAIKGKPTSFDEFTMPDITLKIAVNPNDLFGATTCNTLEILPYIPGSFEIKAMRFYTIQDYRNKSTVSSLTINTAMPEVGASKIVLKRTIDLYICEMDIHINFQNAAGKYPFGLRHLYFLNSNYNDKSYIVVKMSRDAYIDWVSDDITIHDQNGIRNTTCTEEDIKLYANYVNGILSSEIAPTKGVIQNSLARNIRDFYVKVPIKCAISSIRFKNIGTR